MVLLGINNTFNGDTDNHFCLFLKFPHIILQFYVSFSIMALDKNELNPNVNDKWLVGRYIDKQIESLFHSRSCGKQK